MGEGTRDKNVPVNDKLWFDQSVDINRNFLVLVVTLGNPVPVV